VSGDEQWKGNGVLGHKSCLTIELELREKIAELEAELSRHHLAKSYFNPNRMACEYR